MKPLFCLFILVSFFLQMQAQELVIHKTDGSTIPVPLHTIDSITFFSSEVFVCGVSTISDIDGNVYSTVEINNRCWMAENLKTTTYSNNTALAYPGEDAQAWSSNTSGAYAWYHHDVAWKDSYGALYNYFAVVSPNGICPDGWQVPTDEEWADLLSYIEGPNSIKGNKLKSCRQVDSPLGGDCATDEHPRWNFRESHYGTDDYGFSGLPGGGCNSNGQWLSIGATGTFWTSTEYMFDNNKAWVYFLNFYDGTVNRVGVYKNAGFSIRCIMN